jgi:hypothetical protein
MQAENRWRPMRWLPWLAVCFLCLYLASPSLTQSKRGADAAKDAAPSAGASSYD